MKQTHRSKHVSSVKKWENKMMHWNNRRHHKTSHYKAAENTVMNINLLDCRYALAL
jgi:hypothetical protein